MSRKERERLTIMAEIQQADMICGSAGNLFARLWVMVSGIFQEIRQFSKTGSKTMKTHCNQQKRP